MIIVLLGASESGKSTIENELATHHGFEKIISSNNLLRSEMRWKLQFALLYVFGFYTYMVYMRIVKQLIILIWIFKWMCDLYIAKRRKFNQFDMSDKDKDGTAILIYDD